MEFSWFNSTHHISFQSLCFHCWLFQSLICSDISSIFSFWMKLVCYCLWFYLPLFPLNFVRFIWIIFYTFMSSFNLILCRTFDDGIQFGYHLMNLCMSTVYSHSLHNSFLLPIQHFRFSLCSPFLIGSCQRSCYLRIQYLHVCSINNNPWTL